MVRLKIPVWPVATKMVRLSLKNSQLWFPWKCWECLHVCLKIFIDVTWTVGSCLSHDVKEICTFLWFCRDVTANIISWRLSWHYFDASCFCRHGVSASMWKNLNSEQIKKAWRHSQAVPDSSTRRPSRWHSLWFLLSCSRVQRTFW